MGDLSAYLQTLLTDGNSAQVAYIEGCIAIGWTAKQMRARFRQSRNAMDWQAQHGKREYRTANKASAELFTAVIDFLEKRLVEEMDVKTVKQKLKEIEAMPLPLSEATLDMRTRLEQRQWNLYRENHPPVHTPPNFTEIQGDW